MVLVPDRSRPQDMALAATGSLRRLRKLDSALTATSGPAAPAFLQLQKTETQATGV